MILAGFAPDESASTRIADRLLRVNPMSRCTRVTASEPRTLRGGMLEARPGKWLPCLANSLALSSTTECFQSNPSTQSTKSRCVVSSLSLQRGETPPQKHHNPSPSVGKRTLPVTDGPLRTRRLSPQRTPRSGDRRPAASRGRAFRSWRVATWAAASIRTWRGWSRHAAGPTPTTRRCAPYGRLETCCATTGGQRRSACATCCPTVSALRTSLPTVY